MRCWLAENGHIEAAYGKLIPVRETAFSECQPPWDRAHLIRKETIKHAFPHGAYLPLDAYVWKPIHHMAPVASIDKVRDLYELIHDERIIRISCRAHHTLLDNARKLRILPDDLPVSVYEFATEMGLLHWLQLEYRERVAA